MTVAVVIPTLPERAGLLAEALVSAARQTRPADVIVAELDRDRRGPAAARNRAVARLDVEWFAWLDDDDLFLEHHLETLLGRSDGADVVYSRSQDGPGRRSYWRPDPPTIGSLRRGNEVPVTALVRASTFRQVGGFPETGRYEDWQLWLRMAKAGATFRPVDEVTWCYRHGGWPTLTDTPDGLPVA